MSKTIFLGASPYDTLSLTPHISSHMIKYKYIPFDFVGKQRYGGKR